MRYTGEKATRLRLQSYLILGGKNRLHEDKINGEKEIRLW